MLVEGEEATDEGEEGVGEEDRLSREGCWQRGVSVGESA